MAQLVLVQGAQADPVTEKVTGTSRARDVLSACPTGRTDASSQSGNS